jgi:amino-acid N-acetyltransferase
MQGSANYIPDMTSGFAIEPARATDLGGVLDLLRRSKLPTDDLERHLDTTLVARRQGTVVGSAALELYGTGALLRSVAVDASLRGLGLGHQLTDAALALAREKRVLTVYLLTTTAGDFFPRFGFRPIARAEVAQPVQQSVEFTSACPASAQAMAREL